MASRIKWNANQRRRISDAVRKYNAAVTRMEKSGKYTAMPNKTSVAREMALIETRDELRQRERELGRILVKNNPKANDVEILGAEIVPQYLKQEMKYALRTVNERRKRQREQLFGDDAMTAMEYATRVANKNLHPLDEENYTDGDDLDALWSEAYPRTYEYAERYKAAWSEYNGNAIVPEIIDAMAEDYPDELALIFESGADEIDINYIYKVSSDKTPVIVRHSNVVKFWNKKYKETSGKWFIDVKRGK